MIPTLRPYQQAMLDAIVEQIAEGKNRILVQAATGLGKTVAFAAMPEWPDLAQFLEMYPANERKMLVIAHREELIRQSAEKLQKANPSKQVRIEQADAYASRTADIVVASIQTLAAQKFRRLHRLMAHHVFRLVVIDEAHHGAAPTYRTALAHLGFLPMADASDSDESEAANFDDVAVMTAALEGWDAQAPKDRVLVGVTATPNRSDEIGLACVFQTLAFSYPMREAIRDGWLTRIKPWVIESEVSLDAVKTTAGDFNQKQLAEAVNQDIRNRLAVAAWLEKGERLPTIAFTVDVAHAHAIAALFREHGIRAVAVSGETPKDERRGMLQRFRDGEIDVLCNCMVLTEGTDLPVAACILHLKPTKSATLYEQMTGRVLRPHPEDPVGPARLVHVGELRKPYAVVIDVVDVTQRHTLMTTPVLQGLPPGLMVGDDVMLDEAERLVDEIREMYPTFDVAAALAKGRLSLEQLRAKARSFDIFKLPDLGALGRSLTMRWKKVSDELYTISYPWQEWFTEMVQAVLTPLGWSVVVSAHLTKKGREAGRPEPAGAVTKGEGLASPDVALRLAETYILQERRAARTIVDKTATWRSREASPAQIARLAQLTGKRHAIPKLTAGEASDLIDLHIARKHREKETTAHAAAAAAHAGGGSVDISQRGSGAPVARGARLRPRRHAG